MNEGDDIWEYGNQEVTAAWLDCVSRYRERDGAGWRGAEWMRLRSEFVKAVMEEWEMEEARVRDAISPDAIMHHMAKGRLGA